MSNNNIVHRANRREIPLLPQKPALRVPLALVWMVALASVLTALGSYGILDNNEGLYAEISREMLSSHDWRLWVIPHLNGLPYMEKPPLLYWLTALSFSLFGVSEWSARLAPALSSLVCVTLMIRFGTATRRPQAGRLAALMFASGLGVAVMSRTLMFDMLLTAALTAALTCAYRFIASGRTGDLRRAYACLALALMAKGVVAILLFAAVVIAALLSCSRTPGRFIRACGAWFDPIAIFIFLAIAAPWHIAASLAEPIFPWFYFINEHLLRFLGRREPHDYYAGSWWYYLPRMALYLFPWSFLLPGLLQHPSPADEANDDKTLQRFVLAAWLLPLLFFSASSAKANYYLIVVMPFAALHLALALEKRDFLRASWRLLPGALIALCTAGICALLARRGWPVPIGLTIFALDSFQFILSVLGGAAMLGLIAGIAAWRWPGLGILAYLMPAAWCAASLLVAANAVEPLISTRQLAGYLQTELRGRPVYLYRNFEELSSLPFYLGKTVGVIESRSNDLFWGNKLQPNDTLIDSDQFEKIASSRQVAVVVPEKQILDFKASRHIAQFKGQHRVGTATIFFN